MRVIPLFAFSILGIAALLTAPAISNGQFGKKQGGPRDPGATFDFIAAGKSSIPIDKLFFGQDFAKQYAKDKGITNGSFTRDQYIGFSNAYSEFRKSGGGGAPGGGKQMGGGAAFQFKRPGGDTGFPGPGGNAAPAPAPVNPDLIKQLADESFKKLDANGDGKLNQDEMPGRLKAQLAKWDKNNDGFIDQNEYRDYFAAQLAGGGMGGGDDTRGVPSVIIEDDELDRKVVVFRVGAKMPAGLPPWFTELDKDPKDGQVALNEWRAAGKDLDEFRTWDLNDDGFITIEEALKVNVAANAASRPSVGAGPGASGAFDLSSFFKGKGGGGKGGGGKGGGGFGKGGFGKGGGPQPQP